MVNRAKKVQYFAKLEKLLGEYNKFLIVGADNVGSNQFQKIRATLRPMGVQILMGKNTLMRKCIRQLLESRPELEGVLPFLKGNVGLVFIKEDLAAVRKVLGEMLVPAAAKAGAVSPIDVDVPAGPTGLEPTMTSFFQALNISTKIMKGQIEIMSVVHLIKAGDKVGSSEATLLQKLKVMPFFYGLEVKTVFDNGFVYDAALLDITDDQIIEMFLGGVANIAGISLAIGLPTAASVPHSIANGYKNILAISVATDYTFEGSRELKELLANPEALAAAAAAAAAPAAAAAEEAAPAAAAAEEEEESDEDMGFGLFD